MAALHPALSRLSYHQWLAELEDYYGAMMDELEYTTENIHKYMLDYDKIRKTERGLRKSLDELTEVTNTYVQKEVLNAYNDAVKQARLVLPGVNVTTTQRARIYRLRNKAKAQVHEAWNFTNRTITRAYEQIHPDNPEPDSGFIYPKRTPFADKSDLRPMLIAKKHRGAGDYHSNLKTQLTNIAGANTAAAFNLGTVQMAQAAEAAGIKILVRIHDGPGCGLGSHRDPAPANGLIMTPTEVARIPALAHPNCQRTFELLTGKDANKNIMQQTKAAAKKVAAAVRKAEEELDVRGAALDALRQSLTPTLTLGGDPIVTLNMPIIDQTRALSGEMLARRRIKFIQRAVAGPRSPFKDAVPWAAKTHVNESDIYEAVIENYESYLEHQGPKGMKDWVQYAVGITGNDNVASMDAKWSALFDRAWQQALRSMDPADALEWGIWEHQAIDNYLGMQPLKQLPFALGKPRGFDLGRMGQIVAEELKAMFGRANKNPVTSLKDFIRKTASTFDFLPSVRGSFLNGKITTTIHLGADGRVKLTRQLMKHWKEGSALPNLKDLVDAFTPRITLNPGGWFSTSVVREAGHIVPIIRVTGKGKWSIVSFETRFKADTWKKALQILRNGGSIGDIGVMLGSEMSTMFKLWRNSPLSVNSLFYGMKLERTFLKLVESSGVLRLASRLVRAGAADEAWLSYNDIGWDFSKYPSKPYISYNQVGWDMTERPSRWVSHTDISVLPGGSTGGTVFLKGLKIEDMEPIIAQRLISGSWYQAVKTFRMNPDEAEEAIRFMKDRVRLLKNKLSPAELSRIRNFEDFKQYYRLINVPVPKSLFEETEPLTSLAVSGANKAFNEDYGKMAGLLKKLFNIDPGHYFIKIDPMARWPVKYYPETKTVVLRQVVVDEWNGANSQGRYMGVLNRLFPKGTNGREATLADGLSQMIVDDTTLATYRSLWERIAGYQEWATNKDTGEKYQVLRFAGSGDFLTNLAILSSKFEIDREVAAWLSRTRTNRDFVMRRISHMAMDSPRTMIAQLLTEYLTSPNPSDLAKLVGRFLAARGGRG